MKIEVKEIVLLKTQVSKLENSAQSQVIDTPEQYVEATDIIARLKDIGSRIKIKKESITKPLNEALRNVRDLFAPLENQLGNAQAIIQDKMLAYKRMMDAKANVKEAEVTKSVVEGTITLEKAEKELESVQRIDNTVRGKVGEVQIRKIRKVRITDATLIPRAYLIPDNVAIRRDALGGIPIPGVEVYTEEMVATGTI